MIESLSLQLLAMMLVGMAAIYPEGLLVIVERIRRWLEEKLIEAGIDPWDSENS